MAYEENNKSWFDELDEKEKTAVANFTHLLNEQIQSEFRGAIVNGYKEKIRTIFDNKLEYNGDNQKAIEDVKTWLCCEWQCGQISMEEYGQLKDMVEPIAERMIKEL